MRGGWIGRRRNKKRASLVSPNFIQEQLSWAYVRAVTYRAGFRIYTPEVDDHGIDGTIQSYDSGVNKVDFQLKSTTLYEVRGADMIYDLRVENYNRLVQDDGLPRVLILYAMPSDDSLWLAQSEDELCLRKCAHWVSLMGMDRSPRESGTTRRVRLPLSNIFSEDGLRRMFSRLLGSGGER